MKSYKDFYDRIDYVNRKAEWRFRLFMELNVRNKYLYQSFWSN